jgi:hypothetical protein
MKEGRAQYTERACHHERQPGVRQSKNRCKDSYNNRSRMSLRQPGVQQIKNRCKDFYKKPTAHVITTAWRAAGRNRYEVVYEYNMPIVQVTRQTGLWQSTRRRIFCATVLRYYGVGISADVQTEVELHCSAPLRCRAALL